MASDRTLRNINIYVARTGECTGERTGERSVKLPGEHLGGLWQEGSITDENLHWMLGHVLLVVDEPWFLKHRASDRIVMPSDNRAAEGDYDVYCEGSIKVTDEQWAARSVSYSLSGRESSFRQGVRARDGKCVITGNINRLATIGRWNGFQAAHIFPLQYESTWEHNHYSRWITYAQGPGGIASINSIQNGLLMHSTLHSAFDQYLFSINPDDNYKITSFQPDNWNIDGRILDIVCRDPNDPNHVSDAVLRWHFRQTVLANMRGNGEPVFETDFPPGSDIMATLRQEPYGKERLEMELHRRLGVVEQ